VVVGKEGEEFLREKGDEGGERLWESQHLLQDSQHALPTIKTWNITSLNTSTFNIFDKQNKTGLERFPIMDTEHL